ncbi:putative BTB domain transcription factor [Seiridium cardinale]|uniref:BTB domain transcription factor n=1 Tax=Seiridium cardinale TaxID=138064 RepID=A0ABR2XEB1_9PEZI
MVTSTRSTDKQGVGANGSADQAVGSKHQIDEKTSPQAKKAKKADEKEQKTIEETLNGADSTKDKKQGTEKDDSTGEPEKSKDSTNSQHEVEEQDTTNGQSGSAEEPKARDGATPASILEKGIIYFFFRGRVGIDEPSSVSDVARSYIVLRPIGKDAKLGEGTIGDAGNSRLIAIPKKVLPLSGKDKWIAFVEKSHASFKTLKDEFLSASDYDTKTAGTRHSPAATPVGEGIYAITTTGRENHLAYMLTLPEKLSEVQEEIGLRERGSFILSTRNPDYEAPRNVALPQGPDYPKEVKEEFRALRWMATNPKHLDYVNTQFLLIGESSGIDKAVEPQKADQDDGKDKPLEELEKLEDEDTHRMEDLKGDDAAAIFADLEVHAKDYPKLQTSF